MISYEVRKYYANAFVQYCKKYDVKFDGEDIAHAAKRILNKIAGRPKYITTTKSWCSDINDCDSNEEVFKFDLLNGYIEMLIQFIQKIELLHKLEILEN